MARDHIIESETFELIGAYFSPVSSGYQKAGLAYYKHRVRMCQLAVTEYAEHSHVDPWEARQAETQRTAIVLQHFDEWINGDKAAGAWGVECDGVRRRVKIKLIAGGDLIESFAKYEVRNAPPFHSKQRNVHVVKQFIYNDISSAKVRLFIKRNMSIKYLLPDLVVAYIKRKNLYSVDEPSGRTDGPFDDDEMTSSNDVQKWQEEPAERRERQTGGSRGS
ncbi:hypothetical protein HDU82_003019 [Entophlyctis luteolus]|nr:hypothetical protein HDU82_003019 [Entophlyctis luteolus]